jgi:hypothetical protein
MWQPVSTAPRGRDIELAVIDLDETHVLVFPCRRSDTGWTRSENGDRVDVRPTHWRNWAVDKSTR